MLIFAVAGVPLLVASIFSRVLWGVVLGAILLLIDLLLVPRGRYESPWRAFREASAFERAGVVGAMVLLLALPSAGWLLLPTRGAYWLSLFLSDALFLLWFAARLRLHHW